MAPTPNQSSVTRLFPVSPSLLDHHVTVKPGATSVVENMEEDTRFFSRIPSLLRHKPTVKMIVKKEAVPADEPSVPEPRLFPKMRSLLDHKSSLKTVSAPTENSGFSEKYYFSKTPSLLEPSRSSKPAAGQVSDGPEVRLFPRMPSLLGKPTPEDSKTALQMISVADSTTSPPQKRCPKRKWEELWKKESGENGPEAWPPMTSTPAKRNCPSFKRYLEERFKKDDSGIW